MYNLSKNNYHLNPKSSIIYTPSEVSQFIFNLLKDKFPHPSFVFDPCCGQGSLLAPWKKAGYHTTGIDLQKQEGVDIIANFFTLDNVYFQVYQELFSPKLILCNPPFNGMKPKLAPEIWLDKIIELFGKDIPLVLFVPMGFRANSNKRQAKFANGEYPPISSCISLPKNIFPNVIFHSEILIFNIPHLQPHYFYYAPN